MKLSSWLRRLRAIEDRIVQRPHKRRFRSSGHGCSVELLELRTLLSVSAIFSPASKTLHVASNAADDIVVCANDGQVKINGLNIDVEEVEYLDIQGGPDANFINLRGVGRSSFPQLVSVTVNGFGATTTFLEAASLM